MADILLEAIQIQKHFNTGASKLQVLKGVDLKIERGESVAIVGASGAGKSTLMHILGTLDQPTSGKVFFTSKGGGVRKDVFAAPEIERSRFRNRHMGFVFQFHHLLPEFTALENVMMPGMIAGREEADLRDAAIKILTEVGLDSRMSHRPGELSGGECQRVAVARALFNQPDLLMGDELTGNLDSENSNNLISLLLDLNRRTGVSLVLVTHDKEVARKMSRTVEMRDGKVLGI